MCPGMGCAIGGTVRGSEAMLGGRRRHGLSAMGRRGISLVEALVVVGVLLILAGLLLPALGRVRATVRRVRCAANLRELAVATIQYHNAMGCMPPVNLRWWRWLRPGLSDVVIQRDFSPQSHVLPWLGEAALYNAINFELDHFTSVRHLEDTYALRANLTVLRARVEGFVCPADGEAQVGPCLSYRGNTGLLDWVFTRRGWPDSGRGMFRSPPITLGEVPDGLSLTAMYAERLVGPRQRGARVPGGSVTMRALVRVSPRGDVPRRADDWLVVCAAVTRVAGRAAPDWLAGRYWLPSSGRFALYNHALVPNAEIYDCYRASGWGVFSARSAHAGGVINVAFGDAHVSPISGSIDLSVWRALGTRDGGELVSGEW